MARIVAVLLCALGFACSDASVSRAPATLSPEPAAPSVQIPELPSPPDRARPARVARVIDGDTVALAGIDVGSIDRQTGGRRARLIGINTPETHGGTECFGEQATSFVEREIGGAEVLVDFDVELTDRYGRALVYIWHDGELFNGRLAAEGYAQQATFPPNVRFVELFTRMARFARENDLGLWSAC